MFKGKAADHNSLVSKGMMHKIANSDIDEQRNTSYDDGDQEKFRTNAIEDYIVLPSTVEVELLSRRQSTLNFLKNRRNSSMMSSVGSPEPLLELIDAEDSLNLAKIKASK